MHRPTLRSCLLLGVPCLWASAACGDRDSSGPIPVEPGRFEILSENPQVGTAGKPLPTRLAVRVLDRRTGGPAPGVPLAWSTEDGEIRHPNVYTDQEGLASAQWVLGTVAGAQSARVRIADLGTLVFTAVAEPGPPVSLSVASADTVGVGRELALTLAPMEDEFGNPVTDLAVVWRSLDPERLVVDGAGRARGLEAGTARVVASVGRLADTVRLAVLPRFEFVQVDGGWDGMCALSTDASVYCWDAGRPERVPGDLAFVKITSGQGTRCGLTAEGVLYCWGSNRYGQIGPGLPDPIFEEPTPTAADKRFRDIAQGAHGATCGIDQGGTAWCWGHNDAGQLGRGTRSTQETEPAPPDVQARFEDIALGMFHGCGIASSGETYCWGVSGDQSAGHPPVRVDTDRSFVGLSGGSVHACGITGAGEVLCWGRNRYGQLGVADSLTRATPTSVADSRTFTLIDAGGNQTCALTHEGAAYCWGTNGAGELGIGSVGGIRLQPTAVEGGLRFRDLAAGIGRTCAVAEDATVYCWGENIGRDDLASSPVPTPIQRPLEHLAGVAGH